MLRQESHCRATESTRKCRVHPHSSFGFDRLSKRFQAFSRQVSERHAGFHCAICCEYESERIAPSLCAIVSHKELSNVCLEIEDDVDSCRFESNDSDIAFFSSIFSSTFIIFYFIYNISYRALQMCYKFGWGSKKFKNFNFFGFKQLPFAAL